VGSAPQHVTERDADVEPERSQVISPAGRTAWLLLVDPLPNRVFFDCGIVDRLREALPGGLSALFLLHEKHVRPWLDRVDGVPLIDHDALMPVRVPFRERVARRIDIALDETIGFYPLAVRHSLRHGFHEDRWVAGHSNWFLDPDRAGPLPRSQMVEGWMAKWHFSTHRYVPAVLLRRMKAGCCSLIVDNLQAQVSIPYMTAARRLRVPVVGYVASWDHTVGKGVVSPHLDRYVVQNDTMREDLVRYHGIDPARIVVTGWPQTDVYHRRRGKGEYEGVLSRLGLDPRRPVVLFAGNTPTNSPYEGNLVGRLVTWFEESGARDRFSMIFRPHPRDNRIGERFGIARRRPGIAVQEPSYTDLEDLATLLQHVDCLVANAGTILLDAIVNDCAAVCVTFDEGAPAEEHWAELNLGGKHYRELAESGAFYRAGDFSELTMQIERTLDRPEELAVERRRVARQVVGQVDGRAADRVAAAIVEVAAPTAAGLPQ
jgi:CDP-Glycerol:Poly(glycerophosphate) glycerophosphotransferase